MTSHERENPVDWLVVDRTTTKTVIVSRQGWHDAIRDGAVELGTAPEHCTCVRVKAGVDEGLSGRDRTAVAVLEVGDGLGTAGLTRARVRAKGSARA